MCSTTPNTFVLQIRCMTNKTNNPFLLHSCFQLLLSLCLFLWPCGVQQLLLHWGHIKVHLREKKVSEWQWDKRVDWLLRPLPQFTPAPLRSTVSGSTTHCTLRITTVWHCRHCHKTQLQTNSNSMSAASTLFWMLHTTLTWHYLFFKFCDISLAVWARTLYAFVDNLKLETKGERQTGNREGSGTA